MPIREHRSKAGEVSFYVVYLAPDGKKVTEFAAKTTAEPSARQIKTTREAAAVAAEKKAASLTFARMATRWANALSGGNGRPYHLARVAIWLDTRQQPEGRKQGPGRFLKAKLAAQVTAADVERFITARRKEDGVGDSTVRKEITALSSCYLWAMEMGLVTSNPVRSRLISGIRPSEPPPADGPDSYLTTAEETALLAAAPA